MGEAANRVSLAAAGQSQSIEGTICIAASEVYAAMLLPPIIAKLRDLEPRIRIEIVASTQPSDLRRREADIAIRNFAPTEPDLIARKIRDVAGTALRGTQLSRKDRQSSSCPMSSSKADFISIDSSGMFLKGLNALGLNLYRKQFPDPDRELSGHVGDGEAGSRHRHPRRPTSATPSHWSGARCRIFKPIMFPIWLVAHRELNTSRRVRMVFDLLARELAGASPTDPGPR